MIEDAAVQALASEQREQIGQLWLERARGELSTAAVFAHLASGVLAIGAAPEVLSLTARAVGDEVRHARLCHGLAELYLGHSVPLPRAPEVDDARFGDAPAAINRCLFLIFQSCVNEGIAAAYLQENLRLVRATAAHRVIHELLQDDLIHARIGWAHLASPELTEEARQHVRAALPTLIRLGREAWLTPPESGDLDCPEHGCLGFFRHAPIVEAALKELVLPGFEHLGFRVL
ncbi:MAG: hypothetical protein RL033_3262 [Pseudomonadota bacterium]|jgi:hypothetical protein